MTYTKDNVEGVRFHDSIRTYTVKHVRGMICDLIPDDKTAATLSNYDMKYMLPSLNSGSWKVQDFLYEIY